MKTIGTIISATLLAVAVAIMGIVGFATAGSAHTGSAVAQQTCQGWNASVSLDNNVTANRTVTITSTIPGTPPSTVLHQNTTGNNGPVEVWAYSGPETNLVGTVVLTITPDAYSDSASISPATGCTPPAINPPVLSSDEPECDQPRNISITNDREIGVTITIGTPDSPFGVTDLWLDPGETVTADVGLTAGSLSVDWHALLAPLAEGRHGTVYIDWGPVAPCKPEPKVVETSSEHPDCTTKLVTIEHTITTTDWVFDGENNVWVEGEPVAETTSTTRPATAEECPDAPAPGAETATPAPPAPVKGDLPFTGLKEDLWKLGALILGLGLVGRLVGKKAKRGLTV